MQLTVLVALLATAVSATADVTGHYQAVTESEFGLALHLEPKGEATYVFTSFDPEGEQPDYNETWKGQWSLNESVLHVDLGTHGYVEYRIDPCLAFSEFGLPGCGAGLKATSSNTEEIYGLLRFGLWRVEALPK